VVVPIHDANCNACHVYSRPPTFATGDAFAADEPIITRPSSCVGETPPPPCIRVEHGLWLREIVRDSEGRWSEHERLWRVGEKP
jgi:hypothetical protein